MSWVVWLVWGVVWAAEDQAKEAKKPAPVEYTGPYEDTLRIALPRTASKEPAQEPESQPPDPTLTDQTEGILVCFLD